MVRLPQSVPRVLQVVGSMDLGGAESMLMNVYRAIDRSRVQFDFLVFSEESGHFDAEIHDRGGRVVRARHPAGLGPAGAIAEIAKAIAANGPYAAVHSHVNLASAFALRAARGEGVGVRVAHSHTTRDSPHGIKRSMYRLLATRSIRRDATVLAACSAEAGRHLFGKYWESRGLVVRNCIDTRRFVPDTSLLSAAPVAAHSDSVVRLGAVARMEAVKNHAFLLDVMEGLRPQEARLVLVGDGALRPQLELEVKQRGLVDRVEFLGMRTDVADILRGLDALVMPSHHEGLPLTLIEAQAVALPCLVSSQVSDEADLGLGLIEFLPIDSVGLWQDRIRSLPIPRPASEEVGRVLLESGYDARQAALELCKIYEV